MSETQYIKHLSRLTYSLMKKIVRKSGACNGDSWCGFKSTIFQHFGGPPVRLYHVW